ncbi:molybdenum cofactor guanylyltransferase MobA [Pannonibacter sp. SL95]|uniref:molybdenum cofactor guanylyltransferase MobA n=1 Tax=Pannonibacter sp. SL95 TaxID=2995153 RepID=UPI002275114A|nr:gephyrin-like molybdotransferase Glp [Pannonibacter sp. SL95]MCY1708702.1 molybdenum cofactor guanylyltransferase MobA [Pannonibacter sp. SL95]
MTVIIGCVLAGGLARRLCGADKGLLPLDHRPVLGHLLSRLEPQVTRLVINANGEPGRFAAFGHDVIADTLPDHPGPLAGVLAGLTYAATLPPPVSGIVTVPADTPFIPANLVSQLLAASDGGRLPVMAESATGLHPAVAFWPLDLLSGLSAFLAETDNRRVRAFLAAAGARSVSFAAAPGELDPFFNINTPEDLALARSHLAAQINDCLRPDPFRLNHEAAEARILARALPEPARVTVPLGKAHGRVLAEVVTAPRNVPPADTAAVDGYAFRHADLDAAGGLFALEARIAAGHPGSAPLSPWAAARIFTGAVMPDGADTVAMQEDCETLAEPDGRKVRVPLSLPRGSNRRRAGEDLKAGDLLLQAGDRLRPQDIAALASIGRADLTAFAPIRVGVLSTGDELLRPGMAALRPGALYDANHFLLTSLLASYPADVSDLGICGDRREALQIALSEAAGAQDIILTSGGASHGEEDHLVSVLAALGQVEILDLAIKPGRRLILGRIGSCEVIGLPGNPVAAMISFLLYARPLLLRRAGATVTPPHRLMVAAGFSLPSRKTGRREFHRARLITGPDGTLVADLYARSGSGLISSLRAADGLVELAEDVGAVQLGAPVPFLSFAALGVQA